MLRGTLVALLLTGLASAANPDPERPRPPSAQAHAYADRLVEVAKYIAREYVRPVPALDVILAGLGGLYEAVREPLPAGLKTDLAAARSDAVLKRLVAEARERLGDPPPLRGGASLAISLRAIPRVLDPYCGPATSEELRRNAEDGYDAGAAGLKLEAVTESEAVPAVDEGVPQPVRAAPMHGPFRIRDVLPGSPAQQAGVRPGDILTHIDGRPLSGELTAALLGRLTASGPDGAAVTVAVTLKRPDRAEPIATKLFLSEFSVEAVFGVRRNSSNGWDYMLDPVARIGFVRIGFLSTSAPQQLLEALNQLKAAGARAVIVDLRACPGGYLEPAIEVTRLLVKTDRIASISYRVPNPQNSLPAGAGIDVLADLPAIALIGPETSGGGELIAAALQDNKRATMVGQRTFGKGSVQSTITSDFPVPGVTYKLTTGSFNRITGKNLQRFPDSKPSDDWGVRPDPGLEVPITRDLGKQLKEWYGLQILRPATSREALPLDDVENDPQRQFALRQMRKLLQKPSS